MPEPAFSGTAPCGECTRALEVQVGLLAGRLADLLGDLPSVQRELGGGLAFLQELHAAVLGRADDPPSAPLARLRDGLGLSASEGRLLLLAGLPEEHEGLASVLGALHPRGAPWATPGLAAQLLAPSPEGRGALREALERGPLARAGLVRLEGDAPFYERSLRVAEDVWPALRGAEAWPPGLGHAARPSARAGLERWTEGVAAPAVRMVRDGRPHTIYVAAERVGLGIDAAAAIADAAGADWVLLRPAALTREVALAVVAHATLRGVVPVVVLREGGARDPHALQPLTGLPLPLVLTGPDEGAPLAGERAVLRLDEPGADEVDRVRMWRAVLPDLADAAEELASCLRLAPSVAAVVARDAAARAEAEGRTLARADVAASVRGRVGTTLAHGARLVRPTVAWDDLVLSPEPERQLREAGDRMRHQSLVLDGWGFLRGRRGARGVRVLLSGPPGTGKTLAAEALAARVGVDLLLVDLSQIVSKWVGETEKNLATVFAAAEEAQAVLLFDEADALFAKRTEVSDARDRYANMETSYLLTRLERFEGLAVLSTNIKKNIDAAFLRRLDFVIELKVPNEAQREALWLGHVPDALPREPDVSFAEMASRYAVSGALIRNAAVGAAFIAAANGQLLTRDHLSHSMRREYAKAGLAFPGPLPGTAEP